MRSLVLLLSLCPFAHGQTLTLPPEVKGQPGAFISIPAKTDGKIVRWVSLDSGLQLFPVELLKDSKTAVATGPAGVYRLLAYTSVKDQPSEPAICRVVIGTPSPDPVDPDKPKPPTPKPPVTSFRVIFVYESAKTLTAAQNSAMYAKDVRDWLSANVTKTEGYADARWWDQDTDAEGDFDVMKSLWSAIKPKLTGLPCVAIEVNGNVELIPLANTPAEMLATLRKYKGAA